MRRLGHTYRIHDFGPLTLAFDHSAHGGVYSPEVHIIWRRRHRRKDMTGWSPSATHFTTYPTLRFRVPVIGWARAYRWRRAGAMRLYRLEHRLVMRMFR